MTRCRIFQNRLARCAVVLASFLTGCAQEQPATPALGTNYAVDAPSVPAYLQYRVTPQTTSVLQWQREGTVALDRFAVGTTISVAEGFVRVAPSNRQPYPTCFFPDGLTLAGSGEPLVPEKPEFEDRVCRNCEIPIQLQESIGVLAVTRPATFTPAYRDCETGVLAYDELFEAPTELVWQFASDYAMADSSGRRSLQAVVGVLANSQFATDTVTNEVVWREAWDRVVEVWDAADIQLALLSVTVVDGAYDLYGQTVSGIEDDARILPVLIGGCVGDGSTAANGIAAATYRIPSDVVSRTSADMVRIRGTACTSSPRMWENGAQLGNVIAHEMGHFLGLFHTPARSDDIMAQDILGRDELLYFAKPEQLFHPVLR